MSASLTRSEVEEQVFTMWSARIDGPIAATDDFFALGGDSLKAVRLVAAVERYFSTRIDRSRLFASFTVAMMAQLVVEAQERT